MASLNLHCNFLAFVALCLCVFLHGDVEANISNDGGSYRQEGANIEYADSELTMKACELAEDRGFTCEEHEVETEDGYIITLHRLPVKEKKGCEDSDKVVLFSHGFLGSSTNFLINSKEESLGYLFADACYDTWLLNVRGNTYSLKHNMYTTDDEEFWKFSFDEMAQYDLPAAIEYVLQKTNQKTLKYIGHSQGTTIGFEAFSENKTLAKKISFFGALGAVGYGGNVKTNAQVYKNMDDMTIYTMLGRKSFYGADWKRDLFVRTTCNNGLTRGVCVKLGEVLGGKFSSHFDTKRIAIYFMHTPAGSSVQNLVHWAQMMRANKTRKYSHHDPEVNKAKYGSEEAPEINFKEMEIPVAIFSGANDIIADKEDVSHLVSELPNVVAHIRIPEYNHLDFLWATNTDKTIFKPLLLFMENY